MHANIGKWGNSLALRLPAAFVRAAGLREGSAVELDVTPAGELRIVPAGDFDKSAFLKRLKTLHRMPESEPVVEALRAAARY